MLELILFSSVQQTFIDHNVGMSSTMSRDKPLSTTQTQLPKQEALSQPEDGAWACKVFFFFNLFWLLKYQTYDFTFQQG